MNATTLFSENFDELTPTLGVTSAGLFSTDGTNNVDILGPALYFECYGPESTNCVDLNGSSIGPGSTVGSLESISISVPAAGTYYFSFDLIGNSIVNSTVSATAEVIGGLGTYYNQSFTLQPVIGGNVTDLSGIVVDAPLTFTAADTVNIFFASTTGGLNGAILDDVTIADTLSTPEPATFLFLGSALLAGSLIRRRVVR